MTHAADIPWNVVADALSLGLCTAILITLLRTRRARSGRRPPEAAIGAGAGFSEQVHRELVAQQAAECLDAIARAVERERERLEGLRDRRGFASGAGPAAFRLAAEPLDASGGRGLAPPAETPDRYAGVRRLAGEGLGPREIAERLALPFGEVELAAKMISTPPSAGA
jgi:hypothetical protein